jgi:tellurite resistance protein TehA-like permease
MEDTSTSNTSQSTMAEQISSSPPNKLPSNPQEQAQRKVSLRHRIKHFTIAWFLCTMSTGGLSIALAETPHKFHGLHTIGLIIFFLNIILFTIFTSCIIARTILYPGHVKKTLMHPSESLFLGSWYLSVSVIIGGIQIYGITYGPGYAWLIRTIYILYWLYAALSLSNSIIQYFLLAHSSPVRPIPFTPALFLPGYSAMLTGTIASIIAPYQPPARAYLVILSGLAFQGFGWLISSLLLAQFLASLLSNGFPPPSLRPALSHSSISQMPPPHIATFPHIPTRKRYAKSSPSSCRYSCGCLVSGSSPSPS